MATSLSADAVMARHSLSSRLKKTSRFTVFTVTPVTWPNTAADDNIRRRMDRLQYTILTSARFSSCEVHMCSSREPPTRWPLFIGGGRRLVAWFYSLDCSEDASPTKAAEYRALSEPRSHKRGEPASHRPCTFINVVSLVKDPDREPCAHCKHTPLDIPHCRPVALHAP